MKKINHIKNKKSVIYVKKIFTIDYDDKIGYKVRDYCNFTGKYRGADHNICNLRYKTPKEIPVVFHNGSTYDYHFIIKELAKSFEGQFKCLGENTEKYITISVPIEKRLDNGKASKHKFKFIDSFRFMSSLLSSLVDNLTEGLHNDKCTDCKSYYSYMLIKDDQLIFRCLKCNKNNNKEFNEGLIERLVGIYEFCD